MTIILQNFKQYAPVSRCYDRIKTAPITVISSLAMRAHCVV